MGEVLIESQMIIFRCYRLMRFALALFDHWFHVRVNEFQHDYKSLRF